MIFRLENIYSKICLFIYLFDGIYSTVYRLDIFADLLIYLPQREAAWNILASARVDPWFTAALSVRHRVDGHKFQKVLGNVRRTRNNCSFGIKTRHLNP